jgi:predicted acetyltransferase
MNPGLVLPSARYRESYLEALVEYHAKGRYLERSAATFDADVAHLLAMSDPAQVEPGFVPQTTFWLVDGETFLGRLSLRHHLNDALRWSARHIGYEIRPTRRGQGLGTRILALGLEKARAMGLPRVLLTVHSDNTRSIRVIEANGGVLEDEIPLAGTDLAERRYWIDFGE